MSENSKYRLTTIERLAPSLQQIDFNLTKTVIGQKKIESLAFSISIDKISYQSIKVDDSAQIKNSQPFNLQKKLVQVPQETDQKKTLLIGLQKNEQNLGTMKKYKKLRHLAQINKTILNFEENLNKKVNLATTASTFKNISLSRGNSPDQQLAPIKRRTKKSLTIKPKVDKNTKETKQRQKYAPYLQKSSIKASINISNANSSILKFTNRRKILSTRK